MGSPTVGIIGGTGWMGSTIVRSLLASGLVGPESLIVSGGTDPAGRTRRRHPSVGRTDDNQKVATSSDVIILSVRPQQVLGVDIDAAAEIGRSYTPWFANPNVTPGDKAFAQSLFTTFGTTDQLERESDIDYLSGLSGSGPAFPARLASAMLSHARSRGLPDDIARRAVDSVVSGAGQLIASSDETPEQMLETFMGYEGTTAAALRYMIDAGFAAAVHAGLAAAARRPR
jgi:pyrroline-5-carboxylate reductase